MKEVTVQYQIVGRIGKIVDGNKAGTSSAMEKVRPIRISLEDASHRRRILMRAKDLRLLQGFEKIYVAPDLTQMQQAEDRKLRTEVKNLRDAGKKNVKIVQGSVVWNKDESTEDSSGSQ